MTDVQTACVIANQELIKAYILPAWVIIGDFMHEATLNGLNEKAQRTYSTIESHLSPLQQDVYTRRCLQGEERGLNQRANFNLSKISEMCLI